MEWMKMAKAAEEMADAIRVLLRTFTVDESQFPPGEGQIKYNGSDFQTLRFVQRCPGCRPADIAAFLGVAPTTVQSVVDRLIKRELLERRRRETSKRDVSLFLTPQGEDVAGAIDRQDVSNCQLMLRVLPTEERADFVKNLNKIARAFEVGGKS
tara:strand:- start:1295 stop:1756 length:462 start_codon:yes stop_codon:yes gene_type:complete